MHVAKGVAAVSHQAAIYLKDPVLREFYLFYVFLIKASHSNCHLFVFILNEILDWEAWSPL